nr:MAG TPA: hypothetical protein [Caudoviricetes sp.]
MRKSLNARPVNVKISRLDLCDLMLACTVLDTETDTENTKWEKLHDKLEAILNEFDEKQED